MPHDERRAGRASVACSVGRRQRVEQFLDDRREVERPAGADVLTIAGHDERAAGREDRVEQRGPTLVRGVALPDARRDREHVIVIGAAGGKQRVVDADERDDTEGHTAQRAERRDADVTGAQPCP